MDNSYLFDIRSGVVLATDNRHKNDAALEQVTEYLDRFMQFRDLYKYVFSCQCCNATSLLHIPTFGGAETLT